MGQDFKFNKSNQSIRIKTRYRQCHYCNYVNNNSLTFPLTFMQYHQNLMLHPNLCTNSFATLNLSYDHYGEQKHTTCTRVLGDQTPDRWRSPGRRQSPRVSSSLASLSSKLLPSVILCHSSRCFFSLILQHHLCYLWRPSVGPTLPLVLTRVTQYASLSYHIL